MLDNDSEAAQEDGAEPERDGPVDESMPAFKIAQKFGGVNAFARALDKAPSTCHRWLVSGLIPAKHQRLVMDAAKAHRIRLSPAEFIPDAQAA